MNLGDIYNQVQALLGKDTYGGLVSPETFNLAIEKVNDDFTYVYIQAVEDNQVISDDVLPFIVTLGDSGSLPLSIDSFGYGTLPDDYVRYLSSLHVQYYNSNCTTATQKIRPIEMLNQAHFNMRLRTGMYFPTLSRPVATLQNDKVLVRPQGITEIVFTYFRQPAQPVFDFDIITASGQPIYLPPGELHGSIAGTTVNPDFTAGDPSISVEFEWPEQLDTKIVDTLVAYFRVNIKDQYPPVDYPKPIPPVA
jgi:hypothetical protein